MDPERFRTHSLDRVAQGGSLRRILAAALMAVDPGEAVRRYVRREGNRLVIGERSYDLDAFQRVLVVGAGKAGAPMAEAIEAILGDRLSAGVVIVKEGYAQAVSAAKVYQKLGEPAISREHLRILEAGHPVPDQRGVEGAEEIIQLLVSTREDDLVIGLISGGGSALLVSPVQGVCLDDLQTLTEALLASGADIYAINTLRKHLERLKGGQLARLAAPAQVATLILSDVVGDPLDVIASGPTVPDTSSYQDAYEVLERYDLVKQIPPTIPKHLRSGLKGEISETPKPSEPLFEKINNVIVGSNLLAARAAVEKAQEEGFNAVLLTTYLQGEARQAGRMLAAVARQLDATEQPLKRPACIVVGGETTVTIRGEGLGGRNQEMALGGVKDIAGLERAVLICLATDGGDGPTDAAGAVVTGESLERAEKEGMDPLDFLAHNDAYHFFEPLGDLLKTGPTMTNVNDLAFVFTF